MSDGLAVAVIVIVPFVVAVTPLLFAGRRRPRPPRRSPRRVRRRRKTR